MQRRSVHDHLVLAALPPHVMAMDLSCNKTSLWPAARQEALRWQVFAQRLPLFFVTAIVVYFLGVGLLRNVGEQALLLQILAVAGYTVLYFLAYTIAQLIQGYRRARAAKASRFRKDEVRRLSVSAEGGMVTLAEGSWRTVFPVAQIQSVYQTRDFVFVRSPYLFWLPMPKTPELLAFLKEVRKSRPLKKATPDGAALSIQKDEA